MKLLLSLAFKEIWGHKKFSLFFIANLTLGLIGFLSLDAFKASFHNQLLSNSKTILTADLSISARRHLTPEEVQNSLKILPQTVRKQETVTFYSMVASKEKSRLIEIVGIEDAFPFYGQITLQNAGLISHNSERSLNKNRSIWVYPEILVQLGVKVGDKLSIGDSTFVVDDVILDDVGMSWSGVSFAPRIYIGNSNLEATNLLQKGSTFWHSILFKAPENLSLEKFADELNDELTDPGIRIRSHQLQGEQTGRLIRYLMDYLGLVALSGFFLAIIGVGYFYFSYFSKRLRDLSILLCLGLSSSQVILIFLLQIIFLSGAAAGLSFLISLPAIKLYPLLFSSLLDLEVNSYINMQTFSICAIVSILGSILVCGPLILKIKSLRPTNLFQEFAQMSIPFKSLDLLSFIPSLMLFTALSVWQSHSWINGGIFVLAFCGSGLIASLLFLALVKALSKRSLPKNFSLKMAMLYLSRQPFHALIAFTTISLGVLLINTIDQIKNGLQKELKQPDGALPSFFLFDIQDEQLNSLETFLTTQKKALSHASPMIRSRLLSINGKDFTKSKLAIKGLSREEQRENRMRNRGYNLSYRTQLADSEKLIAGSFAGPYKDGAVPEISVERRFASRIGIKIGDLLKFDIQGVTVEAKISSLREIRWTSFQPNFFIQFQDGVLNEAPKTWVAAVAQVESDNLVALQTKLVQKFPNISIVDVKRVVKKVIEITDRMSFILSTMAYISLIVGLVILFSICHYQSRIRRWDMNLLKVIGAPVQDWSRSFYLEFGIISLLGTFIGISGSLIISWLMTKVIFDSSWSPAWQLPILSLFMMLLIGMISATMALRSVITKSSGLQLQKND